MTKYCHAKGGAVSGKLFGFGGTLAGRSYVRSRRRYVITILSLALSIVLFIAAASFSDYLQSYLDTYAADHTGADIYLDGEQLPGSQFQLKVLPGALPLRLPLRK